MHNVICNYAINILLLRRKIASAEYYVEEKLQAEIELVDVASDKYHRLIQLRSLIYIFLTSAKCTYDKYY